MCGIGSSECMVALTMPDGKKTVIPGLPMQFGAERLPLRSPLPRPGEHNQEILGALGVKMPEAANSN